MNPQCYNFLTHCREGYYDNTIFHRNIPGFMIQGGDPTGTGKGGESIWGKPFRDEIDASSYKHTSRGLLSMANKGAGTNGSQFFITYRATAHLDSKHTCFGRLLGPGNSGSGEDDATLRALEKVPTDPTTSRPLRTIRILDAAVFEDPFEKFKEKLDSKLRRENMTVEEKAARDAKRRGQISRG
jgi:peptidyl-prolyl cis-trans isomerase-like 2